MKAMKGRHRFNTMERFKEVRSENKRNILIILGSLVSPPARAARPLLGSGNANVALDVATTRSHARTTSKPGQ